MGGRTIVVLAIHSAIGLGAVVRSADQIGAVFALWCAGLLVYVSRPVAARLPLPDQLWAAAVFGTFALFASWRFLSLYQGLCLWLLGLIIYYGFVRGLRRHRRNRSSE